MEDDALRQQITKLKTIHFAVGFVLWYGIEKIFLRDALSIGPTGISIIVTVYMATTLLLDVAAGVLADKWGRRKMLITALLLFIASDAVLGTSHTFSQYLVGTFLWGLYTVCYGGTYEALLFDSLKLKGKQKLFQKVLASAQMWFMIGVAAGSFGSGIAAQYLDIRASYFLSIIPLIIGLAAAFTVKEAQAFDEESAGEQVVSHYRHFLNAFQAIGNSRRMVVATLGIILTFFTLTPLYEFSQYVYIALTSSSTLVGILNGCAGVVLALGFWLTRHVREYPVSALVVTALSIVGVATSRNWWAVGGVFGAFLASAVFQNFAQTEVQHATTSKTRAAVTSATNFMGNLIILPVIYVFGQIAEQQSIWQAYGLQAGLLIVVLGTYVTAKYYKNPMAM